MSWLLTPYLQIGAWSFILATFIDRMAEDGISYVWLGFAITDVCFLAIAVAAAIRDELK